MPMNCKVTWMNFYGERGMAETVKKPRNNILNKTLGRAQDPRANGAWLSNFLTERSMKCLS